MSTLRSLTLAIAVAALSPASVDAQNRPMSPRGQAATQVGGSLDADGAYRGGNWIIVDYGRPITRGRDLFGSGRDYGQAFLAGAPVWRLGANRSTRFMTEVDLLFGDQRLPAGEYSVFAELSEREWTLIFSTWGAKQNFQEDDPDALWGAYGHTADRDVLRATMAVVTNAAAVDQLTISFINMTQQGGDVMVVWDDQMAATPFRLAGR